MKKQLFVLLLASILLINNAVKAQDANDDDTPIKVDTLLLTMPLTVSDSKGRNIAGLKRKIFRLRKTALTRKLNIFSTKKHR